MAFTRSEEAAIHAAAAQAQALSLSLRALVAREHPKEEVPTCPACGSTDNAEAGGTFVCADCNHNFTR
jgi:transposase-like protein